MADEPNPLVAPVQGASAPVPNAKPAESALTLDQALTAVRTFDQLLQKPELKLLRPAAEAFAQATAQVKALRQEAATLQAHCDAVKAEADTQRGDAATVKQRAIDDIRTREAAHRQLCEQMTVQAQNDVAALEQRKAQVLAETDEVKAQTEAHLESLKAEISDKTTELTAIETKLTDAKRKLAELLATDAPALPPAAEPSSASPAGPPPTTTNGGN